MDPEANSSRIQAGYSGCSHHAPKAQGQGMVHGGEMTLEGWESTWKNLAVLGVDSYLESRVRPRYPAGYRHLHRLHCFSHFLTWFPDCMSGLQGWENCCWSYSFPGGEMELVIVGRSLSSSVDDTRTNELPVSAFASLSPGSFPFHLPRRIHFQQSHHFWRHHYLIF